MEKKKPGRDNPGVFIPPPAFYAVTFVAAILLQRVIPIEYTLFSRNILKITGIVLFAIALVFLFRSLIQFISSRNTLITIKPASSLQTTGIYNFTRNPMYVGLALVYLGLSCQIGNWWNLILFPVLILMVQEFIIKREERYLERAFGAQYSDYKLKVRRWL